jgi:hypothetical protein
VPAQEPASSDAHASPIVSSLPSSHAEAAARVAQAWVAAGLSAVQRLSALATNFTPPGTVVPAQAVSARRAATARGPQVSAHGANPDGTQA